MGQYDPAVPVSPTAPGGPAPASGSPHRLRDPLAPRTFGVPGEGVVEIDQPLPSAFRPLSPGRGTPTLDPSFAF